MANSLLKGLEKQTNYKRTENGAVAHKSTLNKILDLFALGGAYRSRSDEDCIVLFKNALEEDETLAIKCLFYLRDILEGAGERRFFRVCMRWLASERTDLARRNLKQIPQYGRWDDLYCFIDTPLEKDALDYMFEQFKYDLDNSHNPSLLGKWLKSCNSSSKETRRLGNITCEAFGLTKKEYRQALSKLRGRLKVVEKLMSENRWEEIEFDKLPSQAGLRYNVAFLSRNSISKRYKEFINSKSTKVNAKALYPYEVVHRAMRFCFDTEQRAVINKYWDNLTDWFNEQSLNALAVVDTSGSMEGRPLEVAISLGMYCAERASGPFANHYISFSEHPDLVHIEGVDFVNKVKNIEYNMIVENTNLEAVFDLLLSTAKENNCKQDELPESIIIISDMEIDEARGLFDEEGDEIPILPTETLMESIRKKWNEEGYEMPKLIYWNVDARQNTILDTDENVSYVSGFSPALFESVLSNKTGFDYCLEKINSKRYECIN